MQRYPESPYLCMCERWGGAPGHPWRCDGGAYGLHVPHSGEAQKFPFLALAFYGNFQCPKKEIFLSSWIGDMEPICTPLRSLGLIFFTPVGLTHAEISRLSISLHV